MLLFRLFFLVLMANFIISCGFKPIYGPNKSNKVSSQLSSIQINPIKDRIGQVLHNKLLDLINPNGRPKKPKYILNIELKMKPSSTILSKEAIATRINYSILTHFILSNAENGKQILNSNDRVTTSFNILNSRFASNSAEKDAKNRAVMEAANNIQTQIASYFSLKIKN